MDVVHRGAAGPDRGVSEPLTQWLADLFGRPPADHKPFEQALTHGSQDTANYQRLEFLGDRVLGLVVAEWLFELFPREPEGRLNDRFHALVNGVTCAEVARELGVRAYLKLGKQARDDGAFDSDNVLGDAAEALIGAWYLEAGYDAARDFVRRAWGDRARKLAKAPQHPKAALQEWAAANNRKPPEYRVLDRSGPDHAPHYVVAASVGREAAEATGTTKREAETAAARALMERLA